MTGTEMRKTKLGPASLLLLLTQFADVSAFGHNAAGTGANRSIDIESEFLPDEYSFRSGGNRGSSSSQEQYPLVKELFTSGAPGTGPDTAWNYLNTDSRGDGSWCFPGLRIYKEGYDSGTKYADFAANLCCDLWHASMNVLVLGPDGSPGDENWADSWAPSGGSMYRSCDYDDIGPVHWPQPGTVWPTVAWHGKYSSNMYDQTFDHWTSGWSLSNRNQRDRSQFVRAYPGTDIAGFLNLVPTGITDASIADLKTRIQAINDKSFAPLYAGNFNLKLVGALEASHSKDTDLVAVVQQQGTDAPGDFGDNACILVFQGTNDNWELGTSANQNTAKFCGYLRHEGFIGELRYIMDTPGWKEQVTSKLTQCASVTVAGFSLGGALAELFTWCAHMHESADSTDADDKADFDKLSWVSGPVGKAGVQLPEITGGDGISQGTWD